ncbi:MAG TPA: LysM peptidoglycan-binding domain-containing protein, partial [Anaerolineales bacterium]|nr:LysM peptidoglycan-binding domain-containing protein [Anaerolineales bacterium]
MKSEPLRPSMAMALIAGAILFGVFLACARLLQTRSGDWWSVSSAGLYTAVAEPYLGTATPPQATAPAGRAGAPTPDPPHALPPIRLEPDTHLVAAGETLNAIARQYGVSLATLIETNQIADPNLLEVGQVLTIPVAEPQGKGPDFKIIPDSEMVNGPLSASLDIRQFVQNQGGYLNDYQEELEGTMQSGAQIVGRVAQDFSVN